MTDPSTGQTTPRRPFPKVLEWLSANPLPAVTIAGLWLYVQVRMPYAIFCEILGISPEELGLTYVGILAKSTVYLIYLSVGLVFTFAFLYVVFWLLYLPLYLLLSRGRAEPLVKPNFRDFLFSPLRRCYSRYRALILVLLILYPAASFGVTGYLLGNKVQNCIKSSDPGIFGIFLLGIRADRVVSLVGVESLQDTSNLYFLGINGDRVLLYDCRAHAAIRVKYTDKLVIQTSSPKFSYRDWI